MKRAGFTLIEMLVVVLIIGVLSSVALPQYRTSIYRTRAAEAQQLLPVLFDAREHWIIEKGYHWNADGSAILKTPSTTVAPRFSELYIETKMQMPNSAETTSQYFSYNINASTDCGSRTVQASLAGNWRNSFSGFDTLRICYDGGVVCCSSTDEACQKLNIEPCETGS